MRPRSVTSFFDARPEASGDRGEGLHRGHGAGLAVDGGVDAAEARGRHARGQTSHSSRVDGFDRHAVGALLGDPARRRLPRLGVEGHAKPAAALVSRRAFQLTVEVWPASEAFEGERALRRVAAHDPHAGRAGPRSGRADARALEHGHGQGGISPA